MDVLLRLLAVSGAWAKVAIPCFGGCGVDRRAGGGTSCAPVVRRVGAVAKVRVDRIDGVLAAQIARQRLVAQPLAAFGRPRQGARRHLFATTSRGAGLGSQDPQ